MNFLKTELEREMTARREAKELVEVHGHGAYDLAKECAWRPDQAPWQADYWWRVASIVERSLAFSGRPTPRLGTPTHDSGAS